MSLLSSAFNAVLALRGKSVTLTRPGNTGVDIKVAPSNFFRSKESISNTIISGKEFIISKADLDRVSFGIPKRGDRITDVETGDDVIDEVDPMYGMGSEILGYRVRTE